MFRTTMHEFLAKESPNFSIELFERRGFRKLICKALNKAQRFEQRECPLGAVFVTWIVLALSLHRSKSYPNILTAMLGLMREIEPELSLRAVQPNSICDARARLGWEPMEDLFHRHAQRIGPKPSFLGLRTFGIDGVRFLLPDTHVNEWAFGRPDASRGEAAFPQMLGVLEWLWLIPKATWSRTSSSVSAATRSAQAAKGFSITCGGGTLGSSTGASQMG